MKLHLNETDGAGIVILCPATKRALFLLRDDGYWAFPGGKREIGETYKECAIRETLEEAGFLAGNTVAVGSVGYGGDNLFMALVDEEFEPTLSDEHVDYQWAPVLHNDLHPKATYMLRLTKALQRFK